MKINTLYKKAGSDLWDLQVTSRIAGACWALPMPLVTSQTYVPASSDLIGEIMSAPSGWTVTRPWVRGGDHCDDHCSGVGGGDGDGSSGGGGGGDDDDGGVDGVDGDDADDGGDDDD